MTTLSRRRILEGRRAIGYPKSTLMSNDGLKIYRINFPNGKVYVGRTSKALEERLEEHFNSKRKSILSYALKEFPKEEITIELIDECMHWAIACHRESFWIKELKSNLPDFGYNRTRGGFYDRYDRKHNPAHTKRHGISKHNKFYNGEY